MDPIMFWVLLVPGLLLVFCVYFYLIDPWIWNVLGWIVDPLDPFISRVWKWTERLRRW